MARVQCPYCHEFVPDREFAAHEAAHRRPRADGQQTDYVTLPPEDRDDGDLADVPRVYVHRKCGVATQMPEDIVRSYLQNPFLYSGDETFCCGCGRHVPQRECEWVETGENLQEYMDGLQAAKPEMRPKGCAAVLLAGVGLIGAVAALA